MLRKAFGRRLRFLRLLVNKTQAGLAEAVGVTEEHLGNIERGASVPSFQLICRLAQELDTPPNNLFLFNELDLCEEMSTAAEWDGMDWKQYVTRVGYWAFDPDKGGVTFSNSLFEILGYEPSPRTVDPVWMMDMIHPEDLPSVRDCWARFMKGQYPASHTFRFRRKDGTLRLGLVQGEVDEDEYGKLVHFHGVFLDITEQKRFEASLLATRRKMEEQVAIRTRDMREALSRAEREAVVRARAEEDLARELERRLTAEGERVQSEAQLELILGSMTDSVVFFRSPDMAVAWCNQTYAGFGKMTPSRMKGRICYQFIHKRKSPCPDCPVLRAFASGQPAEVEHRDEDGRIRSVRGFPVVNQAGEVTGVAEFIRDITEKRRAEEGRQLFETIVNASTEPMALLDRNCVFLAANPAHAQYHGPGCSDLEGSHLSEFVDLGAYREVIKPQFDRALGGEIVEFEAWINFPAHERTCMAVRFYPHRDVGGEVVGVAVMATDITEAKVIQERLRVHSQILSSLPDAIFFVDRLLAYRIVNNAYLRLYGVGREEIEGRPVSGSMPAEDYEQNVRPYLEQALAGETARHTAWFDFRGYGRRCMDVTYAPCRDEGGAVIGAVAHFRDVTGRVRVQEALAESEERYKGLSDLMRRMADNMPDLLWAKDMNNRFLFTNKAICDKVLKCENTSEPLGRDDLYFAERERASGHNHTFGEICVDSDDVVKTAKASSRFLEDGLVRGEYLVLDVHKAPFFDHEGNMIGTVGAGRDVTADQAVHKALVESEERFRTMFDSIGDVVFLKDNQLRYVKVNPAMERLFNMSASELEGRTDMELFGPEAGAHIEEVDRRVLTGETVEEEDTKPVHGVFRTFHVKKAPVLGPDGRVQGLCGIARDITGRMEAEKALEESEERFRLLAEHSPDIVWLTNSDCKPTYFSPACERILGYTPEEMLNMTPADVFAPECLDRVHADIEEERANIEQGKPLTRMGQKMDITHIAKDGRRVDVEIIRTPIYDSQNRLRGVVGISRDVSEEREAQAKVRESLEKYRILFELEFDAIFLVDDETTRILEANRAAENILGYSRDELVGTSMADLSTEPELITQSSKTELVNAERYYRRKDGQVVPVEVSTSHFYWQNRHVHIAALRDLSDRKRLELERRDVERMLRHELRTPAQAAVTVASVLKEEGGFTGDSLKMLNELERHGRCMLETMDLHADLHRLEAGQELAQAQAVDVADICEAASRDMAYLVKARSVNLELDCSSSGQGLLRGDKRLLRSATINLVKNALEASRSGDAVRLRCAMENGHLVVSVRNPGVVPEHFRKRMFEKYTTLGKPGGQGLGCYLARRVAEAHGGEIRVDCGDGRHTEVVMSLPCRPEQ